MPLDFESFKRNPRYCKPWNPPVEDLSQDVEDNKRMALADAMEQYRKYCAQWDEEPVGLPEPEKPIMRGNEVKFDRNEYYRNYMREFMRKRRAKQKLAKQNEIEQNRPDV
jgi:hypothetical protein